MNRYEKIFDVLKNELEETITAKCMEFKEAQKKNWPTVASESLKISETLRGVYERMLEIRNEYKHYKSGLITTKAIYRRWSVSRSNFYYHVESGHIKPKKGHGKSRLFDVNDVEELAMVYGWSTR